VVRLRRLLTTNIMRKELITFDNVTNDIIDDIIFNCYLDSESYYRSMDKKGDNHLSFLNFLCEHVKKGWFDKKEIQPILKQFLKSN